MLLFLALLSRVPRKVVENLVALGVVFDVRGAALRQRSVGVCCLLDNVSMFAFVLLALARSIAPEVVDPQSVLRDVAPEEVADAST